MEQKLISIIIPAKNEAENIAATVEGIKREFETAQINYEIVVINDGSTDNTEETVKSLAKLYPRTRVVNNTAPYGIGNAIKKGLEEYKGDYVIITMADSSDDPKDMVRYVQSVGSGYDCCFGTRWGKDTVVKDYPKVKLIVNRLANAIIRVFFGLAYDDVTNAFKCYSRPTIDGIKPILSHHFNITVELPLKAIVRGYSYCIVPTNWYVRAKGQSRLKLKEMGSRYLFIMLYVWLEKVLCGKDYRKK